MKLTSFFALILFCLVSCTEAEPYLHPAFSITKKELNGLIASSPAGSKNAIEKSALQFLSLIDSALSEEQSLYEVVDKTHPLGVDYAPEDLESLDGKSLYADKPGMSMRKEALGALLAMSCDSERAGVRLIAGSAYRSYKQQESVYGYWVKTLGQKQADRESARPGHSQHQLGTVVDFSPIDDSFAATTACRWLEKNAWRYGFSLSYPEGYEGLTGYKYEPWHYRYMGRAGAELEKKYFSGLQAHFLSFYSKNRDFFIKRHKSDSQAGDPEKR